jgi:GNAT superfamily N-acetyltransferase
MQSLEYHRDLFSCAWLCDVIVAPEHRGRGLGKWLVECLVDHPQLKTIRRIFIFLATRDAHELYCVYDGFETLSHPELWMERLNPDAP